MDTISTAIIAALANLTQDAVKDSYKALKSTLKQKFGSKSDLVAAVEQLEKKSNSEGRKAILQEEIEMAKLNDNPALIQLAQDLLDKINSKPDQQPLINQTVSHVKYAATSGTGTASILNITKHDTSEDNRD